MLEVDVDNLDAQMPDLLAELLTGAGAIVIRNAFPADEIAEARRLIHHYSDTEVSKETHFQGANADGQRADLVFEVFRHRSPPMPSRGGRGSRAAWSRTGR